ncbi:MAG: TonB-dependent receptor plug domain-containing protein [Elusimicrobiota bacterium]
MKALSVALLLLCAGAPAFAADDAFEFFKEEAQVVTASRRAEPAWRAPAAVDVVTAEDIKAYGFKEIWDALRFRAGMDVVDGRSLDGNRALVSARGFVTEFVAEMQVLVDGRSVYSPLLGGVYWQSLPVQIQDIERIEIVRGPNAALYGSNAGFGVINIITRKPGAAAAAQASAQGGSRGIRGAAAAGEAGDAARGLRISFTSQSDDGHVSTNGAANGGDFLHLNKINGRGRWSLDPKTEIEVMTGGSWMTAGLPGMLQGAQARHVQNFQSAKATRSLGGEAAIEASASRSETSIESQPVFAGDVSIRTYQYEAEAMHRFSWWDGRAKSNWGAGWRFMGADSDQVFSGAPSQDNRLVRGFTHHSLRLADPLTLVAGVSLEHSGTGGTQPAWQAALLATPADWSAVRLSYSLAPTLPPLVNTSANYNLAPGQLFVGNPDFRAEKLSSWELGWSGRLLDGALKPKVSLYYMEIRGLSNLYVKSVAPGPLTILSIDNNDRAIARGAETSLEYGLGAGRSLFVNYTYERITHRRPPGPTGGDVSLSTPQHKFNFGGRAALAKGWNASFVLGYKDHFSINSDSRGTTAVVPRHFRLDARLAWSPRPGWELFVAGQELLQPYALEYADGTASPRTVRGGVDWRFGL